MKKEEIIEVMKKVRRDCLKQPHHSCSNGECPYSVQDSYADFYLCVFSPAPCNWDCGSLGKKKKKTKAV